MTPEPTFWYLALPAVALLGLSKGGFAGVGMLATPLLSLVMPPTLAAGVLLPVLVVQDVVSVWSFRHTWNRNVVVLMVPCAAAGILLGTLFAAAVPMSLVAFSVGTVSVCFAVYQLRRSAGSMRSRRETPPSRLVGAGCGVAMGFTSHIAHVGVPAFQIYATQLGLERDEFVGTSAVTFGLVNLLKIPAYLSLGQLSAHALTLAAALLPVALLSTYVGLWLVRRVDAQRFFRLVYLLMLIVGVKLMLDAALRL